MQSFVAEDASAVGVRERHDDEIAGFHGANVGADGFDDADGLVSHAAAGIAVFHRLVRPEIAAADAGAADDYDRVGRLRLMRASGMFSIRTSPAPNITVARIMIYLSFLGGLCAAAVLFVADLFHPLDDFAVERS